MKHIITIQHPQSEQHVNGMIGSWSDWSLTDTGICEAERIGRKLSSELEDEYVLYTSDLLRSKQTADLVSKYFCIKPILKKDLREFNLGEAIGKSKEWALRHSTSELWPETSDWADNIDDKPFKGSESKRDVWNRLNRFFKDIMASKDEHIIIVGHDGILSLFYSMWLGMDIETLNTTCISGTKGGVSFLREDDKGHRIIERINDLSYLR